MMGSVLVIMRAWTDIVLAVIIGRRMFVIAVCT